MRTQPSPFRVQKFLSGLRYPARKHDVLERARSRGADAQLLRLLVLLPDRDYDSPIALSCEVGRQAEQVAVGHDA
jgi:hypothetical protein